MRMKPSIKVAGFVVIVSIVVVAGKLLVTFIEHVSESTRSENEGLNVDSGVSCLQEGKALIVDATVRGWKQIFRFDLGTQQTKQLTHAGQNWAPTVSPRDSSIVFISDRDGNRELYIMGETGENQKRLSHNDAEEYPASFSPDGTKLVFQRVPKNRKHREIVVLDLGRTSEYPIMAYGYTRYYQDPVFLDNRVVQFESAGWICLMDVEQRKEISKTQKTVPWEYPIFSADRKMVAFASLVKDRYQKEGVISYEVFVSDPTGKNPIQITHNKACSRPCTFTPDGKHVVFLSGGCRQWGNLALWQVGIDGRNAMQLDMNPSEVQ